MSYATRARTWILGPIVERATALPPASGASEDLFSITGQVLLTSFFGLCTVAIPAESIDFTLDLDPDDGGADAPLATLLAVDSLATGTWLGLNATTGGALVKGVDIGANIPLAIPLALMAGDIKLTSAGGGAIGTTARIRWSCTYVPLSSDGAIVAV
jgi:hypothetical protein